MRSAIKELRSAVASGETQKAQEMLPQTLGVVDSMATKGIIHRNAAARTKSRLTLAVNGLS